MSFIKIIKTITATYILGFTTSVFLLFIIVMPVYSILFNDSLGYLILGGLAIGFFVPGLLSAFIFFPVTIIDKGNTGLSINGLIRRYMPYVGIPVGVVFLYLILTGGFNGDNILMYLYYYTLCTSTLYFFCRTFKSYNQ